MNKATATASSSASFPIFGLLGVIFICAKVFGFEPVASWSWWWVLSPFWIGLGIALLVLLVVFAIAMKLGK